MNPVHSRKILQSSADRFIHLYIERFVFYVKLVYSRDNVLQKFIPVVYRPVVSTMKNRSPERKRLENRLETLKCLTRDYTAFEAFVAENRESLSDTTATELLTKMELLVNLMRLEACDFVTGCVEYRKLLYVRAAVEAVACIRPDISKPSVTLALQALSAAEQMEDDEED
jgi:hypothetical protein